MIAPGQVGYVTARMDTATLKGPVTKGVTVFTDSVGKPRINLVIRADVMGSVNVLPLEHIFLRRRGDIFKGHVLVRRDPREQGTLDVGIVETSVDWLVADVRKLEQITPRGNGIPPGQSGDWILEVRFRDDEPVYGRRVADVTISTGLVREPRVTIPVETNLKAPMKLSKQRLLLAPDSTGKATGSLFLYVRKDLDPATVVVETEPTTLQVRLRPSGKQMYRIDVDWPGGDRKPGRIVFRIGAESIRLPVEWAR